MTIKILALTDALGNLVHFVLLPGYRLDTVGVEPVIAGIEFGALLADKAFDSNALIAGNIVRQRCMIDIGARAIKANNLNAEGAGLIDVHGVPKSASKRGSSRPFTSARAVNVRSACQKF